MEAGKVSRSALGSGLLRAAHVREDPPPWILEDTLGRDLLAASEVALLEAGMAGWPPGVRQAFRVSHTVRARLAEDVAVAGVTAGRRDYVVLGAGLDTFAWRHPRAGEPVTATYTRDEVAALLAEAGFGHVELFDSGRRRQELGRADLPLPSTTMIAVATV
jgi:O-methyltransferase involved in polyketide biosynthesis